MEIIEVKLKKLSEMKSCEQARIWFQKIFGDYFIGRRCRSQWLLRELNSNSGDKTLRLKNCLDAGCDDGTITILLARKYPKWEIIGIDKNEGAIRAAKYRKCLYQVKNARFVQANLFRLDGLLIGKETFDLVMSLDTMEHIKDDILLLKKFNQLLRLEGILILHVPAKDQRHFLKKPYSRPHPDHVRIGYSKEEIMHKLERTGFRVSSVKTTIRASAILACDIENYLAVYGKKTLFFFLLHLLSLPSLYFLVRFDLLCGDRHGNGIIIKAIKESKI